uniref:Katanin p80 WD40 repeat-containing subunit B1 1 n=1 Tax=Anthurium amnicola TaxID=1678845 RepID=A0A1D1YJU6_9ARAE
MGRLSVSQNTDPVVKENKVVPSSASIPNTPQRAGVNSGLKITTASSVAAPNTTALKRSSSKANTTNIQVFNKADVVPVIVPRTSPRVELPVDSRKEIGTGRTVQYNVQSKLTDFRKVANNREDETSLSVQTGSTLYKSLESNEAMDQNFPSAVNGGSQPVVSSARNSVDVRSTGAGKQGATILIGPNPNNQRENYDARVPKPREVCSIEAPKRGRTRSLVANWEKRERSPSSEGPISSNSFDTSVANLSYSSRGYSSSAEEDTVSGCDEDAIAYLLEQHEEFLASAQSRLTKLQVVHRLWRRNDLKSVINAMEKMLDNAVGILQSCFCNVFS